MISLLNVFWVIQVLMLLIIYRYRFKEHGILPIALLNYRNSEILPQPDADSNEIPTCPYDPSLIMKYDGITREKGRATRIKWLFPMSKRLK